MFARWNLPKVAEKAITSVKPGTKFPGQKTVGEIKADAKLKKAENKLDKTLEETEKNLKNLTEKTKKNQKSLRDYLLNK